MKCNIIYFKIKNDLVAHDLIGDLNLIRPADGKLEEKEGPIGCINSCGGHCKLIMYVFDRGPPGAILPENYVGVKKLKFYLSQ